MLDRSRFAALVPQKNLDVEALVVGLGTLGSWTCEGLARLGIKSFILYDPDEVGEENLAVQMYSHKDLYEKKTDALATHLQEQFGCECITQPHHYETTNPCKELLYITFALTDNMDSRRQVWNDVKPWTMAHIDARMGGEVLDVYVVIPNTPEAKQYEKVLRETKYSEDPCGATSTPYNGMFAGAFITALVKRILTSTPGDVYTKVQGNYTARIVDYVFDSARFCK